MEKTLIYKFSKAKKKKTLKMYCETKQKYTRVSQGLRVYGIQEDFKSSIRCFDAKIGRFHELYLLWPHFGISHEI